MAQAGKINGFITEIAAFIKNLEIAREKVKHSNDTVNSKVKLATHANNSYVFDCAYNNPIKQMRTNFRAIGIIQEKLQNQKRALEPIVGEIDETFKDLIIDLERVNGSQNIKTRIERLIVAFNSVKISLNDSYAITQCRNFSLAAPDLSPWPQQQPHTLGDEESITSSLSSCLIKIKKLHQEIHTHLEEFGRLKLEHDDHQRVIAETEDRMKHEMVKRDAEIEELRKQMAQMRDQRDR